MNLDTVLKCAKMAAVTRHAALGFVDDDILELIAELETPAPVEVAAPEEAPASEEAPAPADEAA